MATTATIESVTRGAIGALLAAAGIAWHRVGEKLADGTDWSAGRVAVEVEFASSSLDAGQLPAGYPRLHVSATCQTYSDDDNDRAALDALIGSARTILESTTIPADLTAQASGAYFYTMELGPTFQEDDGRLNGHTLTYDLIARNSDT